MLGILADPAGPARLAAVGWRSVIARCDLRGVGLPRQSDLVEAVAAGTEPEMRA